MGFFGFRDEEKKPEFNGLWILFRKILGEFHETQTDIYNLLQVITPSLSLYVASVSSGLLLISTDY